MAVYRVGEQFRVAFGKDKNGWRLNRWMAVYRCDCGELFVMQCRSESGTQSCGCFAKETARKLLVGNKHRRTHNQSKTLTYKSWSQMKNRCQNSNYAEFDFYGGRGIKFCETWNRFEDFLKDMGGKTGRHNAGQNRREWRLRTEQLSMGDTKTTGEKYEKKRRCDDRWSVKNSSRVGGAPKGRKR